MWRYAGWESISTLAGEIEEPQKVIPKALMIGTPLVILTYFFTAFSAIRVADIGDPNVWTNMWTGGGYDFVELAQTLGGGVLAHLMLIVRQRRRLGFGGLIGILTGPTAYPIFKSTYKGVRGDELERASA
jgi:amino acid transporter